MLLVFNHELPAGHRLTLDDLSWQTFDKLDADRLLGTVKKDSLDPEAFKGAVLRRSVSKGASVQQFNLLKPGDPGFLAVQLAPSKRAYSIKVDKHAAQAGLVAPGDYVDVIGTVANMLDREGNRLYRLERSFIAATHVRVLAVNKRVVSDHDDSDEDGPSERAKHIIVTLEVSPTQATQLALADEQGADVGRVTPP